MNFCCFIFVSMKIYFIDLITFFIMCVWAPCHHGIARRQVADGGDGLQIWRVAANILNKQSRTADNERSSSLGFGRGTNNSSPKKLSLLRKFIRSLGHGLILWIMDLSARKWT
jgi:hypothetical protein